MKGHNCITAYLFVFTDVLDLKMTKLISFIFFPYNSVLFVLCIRPAGAERGWRENDVALQFVAVQC